MKILLRSLTVVSLFLAVVLFAGCGDEEKSSASATPKTKAEIKEQAQSLSGEIRAMLAPARVRITEVRQTLQAHRSEVEPELDRKLQELEQLRDSLDQDLQRLTDDDVDVSESEREQIHRRLDTFQRRLRETYLRSIQRRDDFYKAVNDRLDELTSRINRMELELEEAKTAGDPSYWQRIAELREQRQLLSDRLEGLPSGAEKGYRDEKRKIAGDVTQFGLEVDRAADSLYAALAAKGKLTREPS
ncbi:hypothetical protein CRI94_12115 [Longibacter salinarum]|uniref:Uncharacterized protein n=1 Tax=Longibacter salinarum TaxID=1850348 RepID=A0A2A8CVY2_9BACT|nr:hypothetical protein [Longibacter salinarum]PEN12761.1 hypothetical protein CRI94_12115 [Longibacter salinarum]